jgi:hypothetical protein
LRADFEKESKDKYWKNKSQDNNVCQEKMFPNEKNIYV